MYSSGASGVVLVKPKDYVFLEYTLKEGVAFWRETIGVLRGDAERQLKQDFFAQTKPTRCTNSHYKKY